MNGRYERLEDIIAFLSDDALRRIIYDSSSDYERYAIDMAKAELEERYKDITQINA